MKKKGDQYVTGDGAFRIVSENSRTVTLADRDGRTQVIDREDLALMAAARDQGLEMATDKLGSVTFAVPDGWERVADPGLDHPDWLHSARTVRSHTWRRHPDGMLMRPERVWLGQGTWAWGMFDPATGEHFEPNELVAETKVALVVSGWWGCTNPKCVADGITQHREGEPCRNGRPRWTREQVMREAIHPDSGPDVDLYQGDQQARPGTTTTRWSGGSGRGSL